ncbi:hypothetical protein [Tolypothrix sp. PCC 7910]|uniref:hypothetical protein n=1 Tax=Tolypothrix sp. PCC 7910 TaxID=2099387 RepID=UPI001FCB1458|nr:hypothetical protein [Tolypothrix sp. PCC 7910]
MHLALTGVKIAGNSCHCGQALSSLKLPDKCVALGIVRDMQVIPANAEPAICDGDYILAVALNSALVPMLKFALNQKHPIHYAPPKCLLKNYTNLYQEMI